MVFTKGSVVEVSSDEVGFHDVWYVATILDVDVDVDVGRKSKSKSRKKTGYRVKYHWLFEEGNSSEHLTKIVDPSFVRPLPPPYPRRSNNNHNEVVEGEVEADLELFDVVDAYHLNGWWIGVVNEVIIDAHNIIRKYIVSFESPPTQVEFQRKHLRLHVDWVAWVDHRWQVPPKKTPEQESKSNHDDRLGFKTPSKEALMADPETPPTVGPQISATNKITLPQKAVTHADTVGGLDCSSTYITYKRIARNSQGGTEVMVEASGSHATHQDSLLLEQEKSITETCEAEAGKSAQKRKRGRLPTIPNSLLLQGGSRDEPGDAFSTFVMNTAMVNNREYQQEWPFIKKSPIWATIESEEVYQNPTQEPHFLLLKNIKEDYREGVAIGYMVTFAKVVKRISKLQVGDPTDIIERSLDSLAELETNGFDVGGVRAFLNALLSRKAIVGELNNQLKEAVKELEKHNLERSKITEEIDQLDAEMQGLQEKRAMKDEEIMKLVKRRREKGKDG